MRPFASAVLLCLPIALGAQSPHRNSWADSSIHSILSRSTPDLPARVLRQRDGALPPEKLTELGDSLVARAVAFRPTTAQDTLGFGSANSAVVSFLLAGTRTALPGRPYSGALDRLIRIHRQSSSNELRSRALEAMLGVADRERALGYIRSVAISRDPSADRALSCLLADAQGGGVGYRSSAAERRESIGILRELAMHHLVKDTADAQHLDLWYVSQAGTPRPK